MHPIIHKTFGGLSPQYYLRQFFFGLLMCGFVVFVSSHEGNSPLRLPMIAMLVVNTLLYPYARFVYESIVGFIMGDNLFLVNAVLMMFVKIMTMAMCWSFALFIAPIGLIYLYFHHSRASF